VHFDKLIPCLFSGGETSGDQACSVQLRNSRGGETSRKERGGKAGRNQEAFATLTPLMMMAV